MKMQIKVFKLTDTQYGIKRNWWIQRDYLSY